MAIIGLVITLVFEKRKSQQAIELGNQLKEYMGFIEVETPRGSIFVHFTAKGIRIGNTESTSHRVMGWTLKSRWVTTQIQNIDRLKEAHRQGSLS